MRKKNLKKSFFISIIYVILAAAAFGCGKFDVEPVQDLEKYSCTSFDAFDTAIVFTAYCSSQEEFDALAEEVNVEFLRYHQLFDIYNCCEGINNIKSVNDNAGIEAVTVDPEIIELLQLAKDMYSETGGKVNVAMGSVLRLWHNARSYAENYPDEAKLPDDEKLREASAHCNIDDLIIDETAGTVYLADPEMSLDVGSVAKGFAVEKVAQHLIAEGVDHAAINAGGNVRTIGSKPDGSWRVGIQNPDLSSDEPTIMTIELDGKSVVTSGVYERNFSVDGKVYHHIIDGDSLYPENRYLSVSVITEDSGWADALSTALFNMDYEESRAFVDADENLDAIWVMPDGKVISTL